MKFSFNEIDNFLESLDKAENDDALRKLFSEFSLEYDTDLPSDPFSKEYRDKQFEIYKKLANKPYSPANEVTSFDVDTAAIRPFPFRHESCELVGNHLLAIGFMIKSLKLPPNARILEFGPGWGNTTLILAKMGFSVTAIDIEQNFVDLIKKRAAMEKLKIDAIKGDFSIIKELNEKYDAILFFECFHHAQDHLDLIASFDKVLKPDGIVCFASEPISGDFPIPWGLRMDGESIWAIRKNGWLELGYNIGYFHAALNRFGFEAIEHVGSDGPWSKTLIARRITRSYEYRPGFEPLKNQIGHVSENGLKICAGENGCAVYGPYHSLASGKWILTISVADNTKRFGEFLLDIIDDFGSRHILDPVKFLLDNSRSQYTIRFETPDNLKNFEVRIFFSGDSEATLSNISLQRDEGLPQGTSE